MSLSPEVVVRGRHRAARPLSIDGRHRRGVDADTVDAWCARYAAAHDPALRERIVETHQWLVRVCARRLLRRSEQLDDLVQVGNIGLLKALDRFDPSFGVAFHTYASATIIGELRRHYRSVWLVRVPRGLQERHLAARNALAQLENDLSRTPSTAEVAAYLGLSVAETTEALALGARNWVESFSANAGAEDGGGAAAVGDDTAHAEDRVLTSAILQRLPERERTALYLTHFGGWTQEEVGGRLGMTQVQVSRMLRRCVDRLRGELGVTAAG